MRALNPLVPAREGSDDLEDSPVVLLRTRTNVDMLVDDTAATLEGALYALKAQVAERNVDEKVIRDLCRLTDAIAKISREDRARAEVKDNELGNLTRAQIEDLARKALESDK